MHSSALLPRDRPRHNQGLPAVGVLNTGQFEDGYINLIEMGARWYDPVLGRWMQPDIIVPLATQGVQAFDRYAYVNNSPTNYVDPSGHMMASDSQGSGSEHLEETLNYFKEYGEHGDLFNEFYSLVHYAEIAYAEAVEDGFIDEGEANLLDVYQNAKAQAYARASSFVSQNKYNYQTGNQGGPSFLIRGANQGFKTAYKLITIAAGVVVVFGHGARHLAGTGLAVPAVESAIAAQAQAAANSSSGPLGPFWGRVTVDGVVIEYRAWILPDGRINIGTYYEPKKQP